MYTNEKWIETLWKNKKRIKQQEDEIKRLNAIIQADDKCAKLADEYNELVNELKKYKSLYEGLLLSRSNRKLRQKKSYYLNYYGNTYSMPKHS